MNWLLLLPALIQLAETLIKGKKKGKIKKAQVMDLAMAAFASGQVKLPPGMTIETIKPVLGMLIDLAVSMMNSTK